MQGLDVNAKDNLDLTPLHHLAWYSGKGYDFDHISPRENIDVVNKYINIVDYLVTTGADIDAKNKEGKTPLHCVMFNRSKDRGLCIAEALIEKGANVNAKDNYGKTPLDRANDYVSDGESLYDKFKNDDMKRLLCNAGGKSGKELSASQDDAIDESIIQ